MCTKFHFNGKFFRTTQKFLLVVLAECVSIKFFGYTDVENNAFVKTESVKIGCYKNNTIMSTYSMPHRFNSIDIHKIM